MYYGTKLDHTLVNPNQIRHYGINLWDNPYDPMRDLSIEVNDELTIPLNTSGTKVQFVSRTPTQEELETCPRVVLTSPSEWNPKDTRLGELKSDQPDHRNVDEVTTDQDGNYVYLDIEDDTALLHSIEPSLVRLSQLLTKRVVASINEDMLDVQKPRTYISTDRHTKITSEVLAERFCIGHHKAMATLRATTQRGLRSAILPLARRYKADRMLSVKRLAGSFATDTLYSKIKSLHQNIASQIYSHKCGFNVTYHLKKVDGENVGFTLSDFVHEYGAPQKLTYDGAQVQRGSKTRFVDIIRRANIDYHVTSPRRPNENPAESAIREVKKRWYRIQHKKNIPSRLWDYGITWVCETGNVTVSSSKYADGRTPLEIITGDTPDISEYLDFGFYDWVTYKPNAGVAAPELGRWLGVSHHVGKLMSYWVLPESGIPVSATTVQRVTNLEEQTEEFKANALKFEEKVKRKWEVESAQINENQIPVKPESVLDLENEDEEFREEFHRVIDEPNVPHIDDVKTEEQYNNYVNMEISIQTGDDTEPAQHARVKRRAVDVDGIPMGTPNENPILDQRQYEVEFNDGRIEIMTANIIAENLLAQVDEEGHRQLLLDEITDHRILQDAVPKDKGTYKSRNGHERLKRTTKGWELYVTWKGGSGDWIALKDLKESYPVELAEYAVNNNLVDEPAFKWWVPYVLKKRERIIKKLKTKYWQRSHKYGLKIPKSVAEAIEIDKENGDTMWMDAVRLEMKNNRVAFERYDGKVEDLIGFQEITGHIIFDVKLGENFCRKARFVADGHKIESPPSLTYSSVVSRDCVRILLTIAALNDLDIQGADIQNAFLTAPNQEKTWIRAGPEFESEQGQVFIVVRALYGLKSSPAAFRAFMAEKIRDAGFYPSVADQDVWMRPATKANGEQYYEYVLMYVDDILAISTNAVDVIEQLGQSIKYKNDKIEPPTSYLGAKLEKKSINGKECWTSTSHEYIKAAIATVEEGLKNLPWKIPTKVTTPMTSDFIPELDGTPELSESETTLYQEYIGMLRWATELGRVDIALEVSLLSQYQASPRQGHLEKVLHIWGYLKKKPKLTLYFDPGLPDIDYSTFTTNVEDFKEQYRDAQEQIPFKQPPPRGRSVSSTAFVDASHGANHKTRKSHTGYIVFINRAPILWYSKRQQTVESSTFSSEFIALKVCVEAIEHLRFKLRMFGIPIEGPTHVFCDNMSVVNNTTKMESTLNKKHSSIAYHYVRWMVAASVVSLSWLESKENLADGLTKRLAETVRDYLFGNWTY